MGHSPERWWDAHRPLVLAVVLAALFGFAELPFAAFVADDLMQLSVLEGVSPCTWVSPLQLYTISDGVPEHVRVMMDAGAFPWFFGPGFKMAFFRPLSSALLTLDHALWGLWPPGYRIQSAVWFVAFVVGVGTLVRRVLPGAVGTLALIIFTISGIHGSLFWTATRHVVIAGALGTLALAAHVHWREGGWRPGRPLSIASFALALAASEAALGVLAYLFAYEVCGAAGSWKERLRASAPVLVLLAAYLVMFEWLGLGVSGGSGYVDPLKSPAAFVFELPERWFFLAGALIAGGNADVWVLRPDLRAILAVVGGVLVLLLAVLVRAVWARGTDAERRAVRWLLAGAGAAAVPLAGSPIGSRCLVLPLVGGAAAMAFVLYRWWRTVRGLPERAPLVGVGCAVLALIHLGLAPVQRLTTPYALRTVMYERLRGAMQQAEIDPAHLEAQRVVVLRAPDLVIGLHAFFYRTVYRLPMPVAWRTLSWAPHAHRFTRTAVDTLELELIDGQLDAPRLEVGEAIVIEGMRAVVLARNARGPTRVGFTFDRSLDDPALYFLAWQDGRLRHVRPPAVGDAITL